VNKDKIIKIETAAKISAQLKKQGKKIIFCSGCFDILHSGHAVFFEQCKRLGDVLVVSVGSDCVIRKLKGQQRPFNSENNRLFLVSAMQDVDYVILGENELLPGKIDFGTAVDALRPDVFVLNSDDSAVKEKKELCCRLGIEIKLVKRSVPNFLHPMSSSKIIKNILDS